MFELLYYLGGILYSLLLIGFTAGVAYAVYRLFKWVGKTLREPFVPRAVPSLLDRQYARLSELRKEAAEVRFDAAVALERLTLLMKLKKGEPSIEAAFLKAAQAIFNEPIKVEQPPEEYSIEQALTHFEIFVRTDHVGEKVRALDALYVKFLAKLPKRLAATGNLQFEAVTVVLGKAEAEALLGLILAGVDQWSRSIRLDLSEKTGWVPDLDPEAIERIVLSSHFAPLIAPLKETTVAIPERARLAGTFVLGPPGSGKTTLLQYLAVKNLEEERTVIIIDSQGTMIPQLSDLEMMEYQTILIEPGSVTINPFTMKGELGIDLITFILGALGGEGSELTSRQLSFFRPCIRLLQEVPGATFKDFYRLLSKDGLDGYREHLPKLTEAVQLFFENEFNVKPGSEVKQELFWRLRPILEDPVYERMFCNPVHRFDFTHLLFGGHIILIDTDKQHLGPIRSALFGRIFVALLYRAAMQRAADKEGTAYVYIDEAHEYLQDDQIADMLDEVRKRNVAITLATQRLDKIRSPNMLSAVLATAVKFVRPGNDSDAHKLAREMRIEPEAMMKLQQRSFALHVRDVTENGLPIKVPEFNIDRDVKHSADALKAARWRTKDEFGPQASDFKEEPAAKPAAEAAEEPKQERKKADTAPGEW